MKILGTCLVLHSVPANLHANRLQIKIVTTLTTAVMMKKIRMLGWGEVEGGGTKR